MTIQAQLADGRLLEFPDGTDPQVIQNTVKRLIAGASSGIPQGRTGADQIPGIMPQVQPVAEPERSFLDRARGVVEAGAGLVSGAVTAPIVTGAEILGTLTSGKFGTPEGIRAGEDLSRRVAQQIQYQPRTQAGQEYTQGVSNALASTGLQGVPLNVLSDLGRVARPAIQAGPGMAQDALVARAARIATERSNADWARASEIDAAQAAQRLGVVVNPAKSNPTALTKTLVSAVGEMNVDAKAAQRNAPRWNELAREDMGLPANTPLTPKAFDQVRSANAGPYEAVRKIGQLAPSDEVATQLQKLKLDPLSTNDPAKTAKVNAIIDRAIEQTSQGLSGENVIGQIRGFRKDASRVMKNPNASPIDMDVAEAQLGIANSLENLVEANITDPKGLDAFRAARTAIAKTYDWERATSVTTKQVDPIEIVKMAEKGKPLSGKLADIALVAGNFPDSSTLAVAREPLMYQRLRRGGIGGTVGFYVGGGPAGAAVGAGLTDLGTSAAANFLTRQGAQNRLAIPRDNRIPMTPLTAQDVEIANKLMSR
jgi:hypothetical protein